MERGVERKIRGVEKGLRWVGPETLGAFPSFPSWVPLTSIWLGLLPPLSISDFVWESRSSASSRCQALRRARRASVSHPAFVFHLHPLLCLSLALLDSVRLSSFVHFSPSRRSLLSLSLRSCLSPLSSKRFSFPIYGSVCLFLPLVSPCLSISPHLCLSPPGLPVSAGPGGSGWVPDSLARAPRRTMPHSRGPSAPWQRARPALPARGPRVPRGCHGYVRRVPAPRAAAPRALEGAGPAGGARPQPLPGVKRDRPSPGLQGLSASVSRSLKRQGWAE